MDASTQLEMLISYNDMLKIRINDLDQQNIAAMAVNEERQKKAAALEHENKELDRVGEELNTQIGSKEENIIQESRPGAPIAAAANTVGQEALDELSAVYNPQDLEVIEDLMHTNAVKAERINEIQEKLDSKQEEIKNKNNVLQELSELTLPVVLNVDQIVTTYENGNTFSGDWPKFVIKEAFQNSLKVRGDAYNKIRDRLRSETGKHTQVCIMEQLRPSNAIAINSTDQVTYTVRGLRFMFWN